MVLKEDGTKWACQACLKGHRVSRCDHTDRDLILVPKKGRPVTQCAHCRKERKKRSAHVACGCGITYTTRDKCIHLREAEAVASAEGSGSDTPHMGTSEDDASKPLTEEDPIGHVGCCCHHGGKCTCAGSSPVDGQPSAQPAVAKVRPRSRLNATQSDPHMSSRVIGVHKPSHHHTHGHGPTTHQQSLQHHLARSKTEQLTTHRSGDLFGDALVGPLYNPHSELTSPASGGILDAAGKTSNEYAIGSQQQFMRAVDSFLPLNTELQSSRPSYDNTPASADAYGVQFSQDSGMADPTVGLWMSEADWANLDWSRAVGPGLPEPAIESASTSAVSEVEQIPPSTFATAYDGSQVYSTESVNGPFPNPTAQSFVPVSAAQRAKSSEGDTAGSNRWSLPASFFGNVELGISNGSDFQQQTLDTGPGLVNTGSGFPTSEGMNWDQLMELSAAGDAWASQGFAGDLMQPTAYPTLSTGGNSLMNNSWLS